MTTAEKLANLTLGLEALSSTFNKMSGHIIAQATWIAKACALHPELKEELVFELATLMGNAKELEGLCNASAPMVELIGSAFELGGKE